MSSILRLLAQILERHELFVEEGNESRCLMLTFWLILNVTDRVTLVPRKAESTVGLNNIRHDPDIYMNQ